ncbi:MAG: cellulase N-terminal Ig-like domain-containing protein, partial [Propionibacteriaceae bacterium]
MAYPYWSVDAVMWARPRLRINQGGYLAGRPMRATLISSEVTALSFTVRDQHDRVVFSGRSVPWPDRPEPSSGLSVHVLDFTDAGLEDGDLQLEA